MGATLVAAAVAVAVAPVPKPAQFGNWTVACDNVRHCEAIALPTEDGSESEWTLQVSRKADAEARPRIEAAPVLDDPKPAKLRIDGKPGPFGFDANGDATGDAAGLLAALANARKVELVGANGKVLGTIPVAGASAALRWIDDQQRRVGTVTALVVRGARPATEVPPAPPLPRIEQPPVSKAPPRRLTPADLKAIRGSDELCDKGDKDVDVYRLDATHTLGIVGCFMAAYQSAELVVVIDEQGHWSPAPIEQPEPLRPDAGKTDSYILTEADYEPDSRLLSMHAKGRGLADCGEGATWAWDGKIFRLASYEALEECKGAPPDSWLSRWQTANSPLAADD